MPDARPSPDVEADPAPSVPPPVADTAPPSVPFRRRSGNILIQLAVLASAGIIVVVFATQWDRWVGTSTRQVTDDAYIRGDITPLSAKIEGYVRTVPVGDFQRVKAGDLLVEIDAYRRCTIKASSSMPAA